MNKMIKNAKNKAHIKYRKELFKRYMKTVKRLKKQMKPLFKKGKDSKRMICSLSIKKKGYSYFFPQEMIDDFNEFLDNLLQIKKFPENAKPFEEFLFQDGSRYSLCSCYQQFTVLNEIEIAYAEDIARYDV